MRDCANYAEHQKNEEQDLLDRNLIFLQDPTQPSFYQNNVADYIAKLIPDMDLENRQTLCILEGGLIQLGNSPFPQQERAFLLLCQSLTERGKITSDLYMKLVEKADKCNPDHLSYLVSIYGNLILKMGLHEADPRLLDAFLYIRERIENLEEPNKQASAQAQKVRKALNGILSKHIYSRRVSRQ
jgi:hypothetical protein